MNRRRKNSASSRMICIHAIIPGVLLALIGSGVRAADPTEEQQQIAVLQSNASPREKDAACARLKRIGGAQSAPALAALLADEQLSHSARYALESMQAPEAGRALIAGLDKTSGLTKAGIVNSLGNRRETAAVDVLAKLLSDKDGAVACAAASALGKIAGADALKALQGALANANEPTRTAIVDGLLTGANQTLADGDRAGALAIFQKVHDGKEKDHIRTAAYGGMIRAGGERSLAFVTDAIVGKDGAAQLAALQLARDVQDAAASKALADLLPRVAPAIQVALIGALSQRNDAEAAIPAVIAIAKSLDASVRLAAITALGNIGDASAVPMLSAMATSKDESERQAARKALIELRRGAVAEAMIAQLALAQPSEQEELARALADRGDKTATAKLMELAKNGNDASVAAALRSLSSLADGSSIAPMTLLLLDAKSDVTRAAIQEALTAICLRAQAKPGFDAGPIADRIANGDAATRIALLPVCSTLKDARVRASLRSAVKDSDAGVKAAAIRALCASRDPELTADLLAIAVSAADEGLRTQAIRGCLRLANEDEIVRLPMPQRARLLQTILGAARRAEDKWLILAALANVPDAEALIIVMPLLDEKGVQAEAAQAAMQIASAIRGVHPNEARAALKNISASAGDETRRKAAEAILKQIETGAADSDYIIAWQFAGPYQQSGKMCNELFDIPFAPEMIGEKSAKDNEDRKDRKDHKEIAIAWKPLPSGTSPAKPWLLDLLKTIGGESRVAYVRTKIMSDKAQDAQLLLGSDDGVKVWLNGKQVYANNAQRYIKQDSDKANVTLHAGWNTLLMKVTQNNLGWDFCARFIKRDGSRLDGLVASAAFGVEEEIAVTLSSSKPAAGQAGIALKAPASTPKPAAAQTPPTPKAPFRKQQIDSAFRSEGVAVADFNHDGKLDIATGNMLYLGPDWKPQPMLAKEKVYKQEGYSDEFYCFAEDVDRDGWTDVIVIGFPGAKTRWLKNPGAAGGPWTEYLAIAKTGNESPDWVDLFKDGRKVLVFISDKGMAYAHPGADPTKLWTIVPIASLDDPRPAHGLGVGDINHDGRNDIVCPNGWWEGPADKTATPWKFHKADLGKDCAQMLVYDVDGDGIAAVISSSAHNYGLWRHQQMAVGWVTHEIDKSVSQLHAIMLYDMNGDGLLDIVTGKRFWAHRHDPGADEPAHLSIWTMQRKDGKPSWTRSDLDDDSGVGLHFQIVDINGDALPDVVTSSKKGVFIFTQQSAK